MIAVGRTMAAILAKLRADLDNAMSNPDWSNSKRMAMVVEARNQVRAALDDAQTTAIRTAAKIRAQVDAVTAPATKGDQTVAELQIAGAWSVAQPFLGGAVTDGAVGQLIALGIPGMPQALRRYLPAIVSAQYAGSPPQHVDQYVEAAMLQLDAAEEPTMSAANKLARRIRARLEAGLGRLQSGYLSATYEIAGQQLAGASLLGFEGMEGISVPPYGLR
jgi:hypothetical protein